jgi:hypothetical protein
VSWEKRVSKIEVGDKVAMKASFLRNTGQFTGRVPLKRGIVTEIKPFGDNALATVNWGPDGEGKVLTSNLSKVTVRGIADE